LQLELLSVLIKTAHMNLVLIAEDLSWIDWKQLIVCHFSCIFTWWQPCGITVKAAKRPLESTLLL